MLAGDAEVAGEQNHSRSNTDRNKLSVSLDEHDMRSNNTKVASVIKFRHRRGRRDADSFNLTGAQNTAVKHGLNGRRKARNMASQHVCAECGRQFAHRQLLVTHLVTHSGERPFPCRFPGCEKRFGQSSTRNYHERVHSDARPFICSQCGLGFKLAPVLRIHVARTVSYTHLTLPTIYSV